MVYMIPVGVRYCFTSWLVPYISVTSTLPVLTMPFLRLGLTCVGPKHWLSSYIMLIDDAPELVGYARLSVDPDDGVVGTGYLLCRHCMFNI